MYRHSVPVEVGPWYRVDTASGSNTPVTVQQLDGATPVPNHFGGTGSTVGATSARGNAEFTSSTQTLYLKRLTYQGAVAGDTPITSTGADLTLPAPAGPGGSSATPGITATGIAATDTAAIQAAHDALPSAGGEIRLAAGSFLVTGGGLVFTKPVRLCGAGPSSGPPSTAQAGAGMTATALTEIRCASGTGNAITLAAGASGCVLEGFSVTNTSGTTPTAGAGIAVTADRGGVGNRYRDLTVRGFYRNFDLLYGHEWYMESCLSWDYVLTGLRIGNVSNPDGGDMGVANCQFVAGPVNLTPQAGIEWISGGGLRLVGCKVNARGSAIGLIGLWLHPTDGITTSVFNVTGCSFENVQYGIYSDDTGNAGTGYISKLNISGNEFFPTGTGKTCIALVRDNGVKSQGFIISGNVFSGGVSNSTGIDLTNCGPVVIGPNYYDSLIGSRLVVNTGVTSLQLHGIALATADRPAASRTVAPSWYYDTTLKRPQYSDGAGWYDAEPGMGAGLQTASVLSEETTANNSAYGDLATPGPSVTATIGASGSALVVVGCQAKNTAGSPAYMAFEVSGASTRAASTANAYSVNATAYQAGSRLSVVTGLTPGANTFTAKYIVDGGTGAWDRRQITVIPL